jgi:Na+-translocating ferredoxin:NAD+ oxidoreductase RNF subunit RnfB
MEYALIGSIIELAFFGLIFGIGLAIAAKKFAVIVDPRVELVLDVLPGANCGACGFPGCSGFAKAVVEKQAAVNGCPVGGPDVADSIAKILGSEVKEIEVMIAVAACNGGNKAIEKYKYDGINNCRAAMFLGGGHKLCTHGCLGYGTCVEACPFDALHMGPNNIPITDPNKCTACEICVEVCPTDVMKLVPKNQPVFVACNSTDPGPNVLKACETGCIACMMCQKNCPEDAIHIIDKLAVIDYSKCTACGVCISVCPTKCILDKHPNILKANKGIPQALPFQPEETKILLAKIKEEQAKAKAAKKATTKDEKNK